MNYYNEFDPKAAAWLRELIVEGLIPPGDVDERSITDVTADDLLGYTQCHFFAGIGGWSLALRLIGWPDDRPVWTGSCPCQPFSTAGKGNGKSDERHLWPAFAKLISECRPPVVFGEQVESAIRYGWIDDLQADMEREDYAVGFAVLGAHSVGAPHIRQRLYWVANAESRRNTRIGRNEISKDAEDSTSREKSSGISRDCVCCSPIIGVADARLLGSSRPGKQTAGSEKHCGIGGLADADGNGLQPGERDNPPAGYGDTLATAGGDDRPEQPCQNNSFWGAVDWLYCRDGKWRPVESGTFPLADGVPGRVGLLRGYGNAIVPQVAAEFVGAFMEASR